jgi:hypothetical protein
LLRRASPVGRGGEEELCRGAAGLWLCPLLAGRGGDGEWQGAAPFSACRGLSLADASSSTSPSPLAAVVVSDSIWWMCPLPSIWELHGSFSPAAYGGKLHRPGRTKWCRAPLPLLRPGRASVSPAAPLQVACSPVVVRWLCSTASSESWRRSSRTGSCF